MTRSDIKLLIDTNLADFSNIIPELHRAVSYLFLKAYPYPGELKSVKMTTDKIPTYFDPSGLGRINLEYEGWAIRNGNNGTDNAGGLVDIGYDPLKYNVLGAKGGSKDAVVVEHSHIFSIYAINKNLTDSGPTDGQGNANGATLQTTTNTVGESGTNKNMQPYIVVLKLQSV